MGCWPPSASLYSRLPAKAGDCQTLPQNGDGRRERCMHAAKHRIFFSFFQIFLFLSKDGSCLINAEQMCIRFLLRNPERNRIFFHGTVNSVYKIRYTRRWLRLAFQCNVIVSFNPSSLCSGSFSEKAVASAEENSSP